mmetsp:Transcript_9629/g.17550  ORF Transcript_9629/g.17550 Transcript_9629/m.17550 type:complete len:509 (+) Transcript_9629:187-1713(+)
MAPFNETDKPKNGQHDQQQQRASSSRSTPWVPLRTEAAMFRSVSMAAEPSASSTHALVTDSVANFLDPSSRFPKVSDGMLRRAKSSPAPVASPHDHDILPSIWNVQNLRSVPIYYPLECTALTIQPESLSSLTRQITLFMKQRSISCIYHDDAGRVDCLTASLVHFSVQLWKGNASHPTLITASSIAPDSVIVEVQRRQGCCIEMQRIRQDLYHFLMHQHSHHGGSMNDEFVQDMHNNVNTLYESMPIQVLQNMVEKSSTAAGTNLPVPPISFEDCENAFSISRSLLKSPRLDQNRMGLESLSSLADARKVLTLEAQYVSSKILTDPEIQSLLLPYLGNISLSPSQSNNHTNGRQPASFHGTSMDMDEGEDETMNYSQGRFFGVMHVLALQVVSHALDTYAYLRDTGAATVSFDAIDLSTPFWNHLLNATVYNMHIAHLRPLEACLSIHCLRLLESLLPEKLNKNPVISREYEHLNHLLLDARSFGQKHYLKLERETQQLMNQLGLAY